MPFLTSYAEFRHDWIERAAIAIEVAAVIVIIIGLVAASVWAIRKAAAGAWSSEVYRRYKMLIARTLLLGLEILVAGDIVHTVAVETTIESIGVLAILVLVRTFLSWALIVENEGRWPWQPQAAED